MFINILENSKVEVLLQLFDYMPDTFFWVKDLQGRYVTVNATNLRHYNATHVDEVRGKNDFDFCSKHLAEMYTRDDNAVLNGENVVNRLEPIRQKDWSIRWYLTTKKQLLDKDGRVSGTFGFAREVKEGQFPGLYDEEMTPVLDHIRANFQGKVSVEKLADLSCLSVSAFERKFKKNFNTTPREYIKQIRLNLVCQELIETKKSISQIALDCGFYDHSFMTSAFRSAFGITPSKFRKKYQ